MPGDAAALRNLFKRMSPHALFLRYHRRVPEVSEEEVRRYTETDYAETFALAATAGENASPIIGVALYSRTAPGRAEVAFVVEESHQGLGVATRLLDQLAAAARDHGIHVFEADVLNENQPMMDVFRDSGYRVESRLKFGSYHVHIGIDRQDEPPWAETPEPGG